MTNAKPHFFWLKIAHVFAVCLDEKGAVSHIRQFSVSFIKSAQELPMASKRIAMYFGPIPTKFSAYSVVIFGIFISLRR
jgi:hypothetical protein